MKWLAPIGLLVLALVGAPLDASAQEPPPQTATPPPPPPPPRLEGSGEIAFVNTAGNAESTSLGVRGEVIYRPDVWVFTNRGAFVRLESDEGLEAQSFVYLSRAERTLSPKWAIFGQYDYLRDRFAGIAHKNIVSGGVSYKAIDSARQKLVFDGGLGLSIEDRTVGETERAMVFLGGVGYRLKLSDTTELQEDFRYVQSLNHGEDARFDNTLAVVARINAIFSLKASNVIRYVNEPVEGFESTDSITSVALVAKF